MPLKTESANRKDLNTAKHGVELQHRHFSFIAATIAEVSDSNRLRSFMAEHFANACAATNPRFDRARFLKACGAQS